MEGDRHLRSQSPPAPVPAAGVGRSLSARRLPFAGVGAHGALLLLAVNCTRAMLAGHAEGPFQHGAHEHEARDYLNDYDRADEEDEGFGRILAPGRTKLCAHTYSFISSFSPCVWS